MTPELKHPPQADEWTEERIAEARAAVAKEMEAEAREFRAAKEQTRHTYRPTRERK